MSETARILVVDDSATNRDILTTRLGAHGYATIEAADGEEAIEVARRERPDLILLDVMMPKLDGFEVCRRLRADASLPFMPIILVTAKSDSKDIVAGLDAGADEYLTKPIDHAALLARVRSILRLKSLHDRVQAQAAELADWNRTLEQRVASQLTELERMGRLKRFLAPQIADSILASGDEGILKSHRREVTLVFCDLRGFTAFAETAAPEDVMDVLDEYHRRLGALIFASEGTLERFVGDGLMIVFNDPIPCADPCLRAVRMAVDMQAALRELLAQWSKRGFTLGFGIGIAHGYATLGQIGFEGRRDYAAIGTVANLAARLCGEAKDGQILIDSKVCAAVDAHAELVPLGELSLKGFHRPVAAFNVSGVEAPRNSHS
ncbi:MAG: adenylate/guanylate cyclase domain-containing protein [Alphaproteobacteria bacterium]